MCRVYGNRRELDPHGQKHFCQVAHARYAARSGTFIVRFVALAEFLIRHKSTTLQTAAEKVGNLKTPAFLSTIIICPKCGNMIEKLSPGMEEAIRSGDTIKCGNCKSLLLIVIAASKQMLFDVFCQSIGMTGEEYITGLSNEAVRGYLEAAEQRLHLTDGILRDLLANPTPRQLSVLKTLLTPPIGR